MPDYSIILFRFRKKGESANVGGIGLGFKEKVSQPGNSMRGFVPSSSSSTNISESPSSSTLRGPATDRLSAMKQAFRLQYQNQVRNPRSIQFVI